MQMIINPGAGPVEGATEKNAIENIEHWLTDCKLAGKVKWVRLPERDEEGRFCFLLYWSHCDACVCHFVDMPGLPLDRVRFMGQEGQNPWSYPRLYLDGSSWLWKYALLSEKDFEVLERSE